MSSSTTTTENKDERTKQLSDLEDGSSNSNNNENNARAVNDAYNDESSSSFFKTVTTMMFAGVLLWAVIVTYAYTNLKKNNTSASAASVSISEDVDSSTSDLDLSSSSLLCVDVDYGFLNLDADPNLFNDTVSAFQMNKTPLPGNFFTMDSWGNGHIPKAEHPYRDTSWFNTLPEDNEDYPNLTRVQVLRSKGITEDWHYLGSDSVWSYHGGCPSKFAIIHRDTLSYEEIHIGPDIQNAKQQLSVIVRAGDYYAHIGSTMGSAMMDAVISPGMNGGKDIITPYCDEIFIDLGIDNKDSEIGQSVTKYCKQRPPQPAE